MSNTKVVSEELEAAVQRLRDLHRTEHPEYRPYSVWLSRIRRFLEAWDTDAPPLVAEDADAPVFGRPQSYRGYHGPAHAHRGPDTDGCSTPVATGPPKSRRGWHGPPHAHLGPDTDGCSTLVAGGPTDRFDTPGACYAQQLAEVDTTAGEPWMISVAHPEQQWGVLPRRTYYYEDGQVEYPLPLEVDWFDLSNPILQEVADEVSSPLFADTKFADQNTISDWLAYIVLHLSAATQLTSGTWSRSAARRALVTVAATAVAAIEALDRGACQPPRGLKE